MLVMLFTTTLAPVDPIDVIEKRKRESACKTKPKRRRRKKKRKRKRKRKERKVVCYVFF